LICPPAAAAAPPATAGLTSLPSAPPDALPPAAAAAFSALTTSPGSDIFTRKMAAAHKYATQPNQSFRSSPKNGSADEANTLLTIADEARANAYAPYSNFHVGAAVLCEDGSIVTGISLR